MVSKECSAQTSKPVILASLRDRLSPLSTVGANVARLDPGDVDRYITDSNVSMKSPTNIPPVAIGTVVIGGPARQRRKEARPQELLDAALELFVERGFAATRSEDVATRAGVSKGTLYLYFSSKEDLLREVIRKKVVNHIAEGAEIIAQFKGSTAELLAAMMRLWWERIGETPASGILKLMLSEVRNFPELAQFYVDEVIAPSNTLMAQMVTRGIASGEFRVADVPKVVTALIAPLVYLALNKHSLGACSVSYRLDPRAVIEAQIDLVLHGLLVRPDAPAPCTPEHPTPHGNHAS